MHADRSAVLVVNTGSRRGRRWFGRVRNRLTERGIAVAESHAVTDARSLPAIVERVVQDGHRLIVVGGGDGTITSIAGSFAYRDAVLGLVPLGTGNSLAQTLGIPCDPEGAIDVIASGKVATVDLGTVNGVYFANVATIGLSADVARTTPSIVKRVMGPLAYLATGTIETFSHRPFTCTLTALERTLRTATHQVVVANGRMFGAAPIMPDARIDEGKLSVFVMRGGRRSQVVRLWIALLSGRHMRLRDAEYFSTSAVRVETDPPQQMDLDGEAVGETPASFSVAARALHVMVPETYREPCA